MRKKAFSMKATKAHEGKARKEKNLVIVLLSFILLLPACQAAPTPAPTPTEASTPIPTTTATATATATPTQTPTISPTAEPAWYQPLDPSYGVLKYKYGQVNNQKARVYASMEDAIGNTGNFGYLPNYPAYVAYSTKKSEGGHAYYLTNLGWMKGEDLMELTPSTFTGIQLTRDVTFRFGWVLSETQSVNTAGDPIRTYQRYQIVHTAPTDAEKPGHIAIGADEWLPEKSVALVSPALPPEAGPNTCRFIYANLAAQTLSVFDKCKLVFATLISSGKNSWTFEGSFAILYKVEYSSITRPAGSTSEYYIEGVPYFMTYAGNFGFHGAYWHDDFGAAASHGCINLAPADSKWLYNWAGLGERVIISAGN
jgi:lipoprotein-anchoring transpeptidase ErfK/SrfK